MRSFIAEILAGIALILIVICCGGVAYIICTAIVNHATDVVIICGCFIGSVVLLWLSSEINESK